MFGWFRRKKRPEKQVVRDESKLPPRPPVKATQVKPQQKHLLRGPGSLRDQDISTHAPWYYTGLYGRSDATHDQTDADGSDAGSDAGGSTDAGSDSGWSGSDSGGGFDGGGGFDSSSF